MRKLILIILLFISLIGFPVQAQLYQEVSESTVRVSVDAEGIADRGYGSGFVYSENTVLTANHVLEVGNNPEVVFTNGETSDAYKIAEDSENDLALLALDVPESIRPVSIAEQQPRVGEDVAVIGYPFGEDLAIAEGQIKETESPLKVPDQDNIFQDIIRTDAETLPGDSGGPLVNRDGKAVGLITAASDSSGFAVGQESVNNFLITENQPISS